MIPISLIVCALAGLPDFREKLASHYIPKLIGATTDTVDSGVGLFANLFGATYDRH